MDLIRIHPLIRRFAFSALLIGAAASPTLAQEKRPVPTAANVGIGSRIRFTEPGRHGLLRQKRQITGTVTTVDEASVTVLQKNGAAVQISRARASMGSLQVSLGRRREVLKNAIIEAGLLLKPPSPPSFASGLRSASRC